MRVSDEQAEAHRPGDPTYYGPPAPVPSEYEVDEGTGQVRVANGIVELPEIHDLAQAISSPGMIGEWSDPPATIGALVG